MGHTEGPGELLAPPARGLASSRFPPQSLGSERALCLELPALRCWEQLVFLEIVSAWAYSRAHFQKHTFNQKDH